ncbi:MAG: hypothetical protein H6R05_171 [Burkholderiaceae bacterium]|nr:hypothetical protein [Burkholderiaceae bacterium]
MSQNKIFNFTVDSALLRELGERLVSSVHVALSELVKNAYDADATAVQISFQEDSNGGATIIIEDNGVGMTPDEVAGYWMRIGTANKEKTPRSKRFGRPKTGRKGVGRFACRRLGSVLTLETTAKTPKSVIKTVVHFDWDSFVPGTVVEGIECQGTTEKYPLDSPTGTRLTISGSITDEWQTRGYEYFRRQLAVMAGNSGTKRIGYEEDTGFKITLSFPESEGEIVTDMREQVIDASWGTLTATVGDDGCAIFTLTAFSLGGSRSFTTKPMFTDIKGAKLRVGILPSQNSDGVRDPKLLANYVLKTLIDDFGGVQIRYNGFRMYPYGNRGDDWLNIDADRGRRLGRANDELFSFASSMNNVDPYRVLLNMLGMRNYIGQVEVGSEIHGLEPRIDRQGFVDGQAFEQLKKFARMAIEWATIYREAFIRQRTITEVRQATEAMATILDEDPLQLGANLTPKATQFLKNEIDRLVKILPEEEQTQTKRTLLRTVQAIEAVSADNVSQLRHLRLVASTTTLTLLFAHEVRSAISSIGAGSSRLRKLARKAHEHQNELSDLSSQLEATQNQLKQLVDMTGIVGAFQSDSSAVKINIKTALDKAVSCFRLIIANYRINIDVSQVQPLFIGPMIEGEIYSIFVNILSNAIKSLIAKGGVNKCICISSEQVGKKSLIQFADNGIGLDPQHFMEVFTPFISDPSGSLYDRLEENANSEDEAAFGIGSGLGLSIARDIARSRSGDIRFVNPIDDWSACVEVELP